jgi:hypothetical protein
MPTYTIDGTAAVRMNETTEEFSRMIVHEALLPCAQSHGSHVFRSRAMVRKQTRPVLPEG